MHVEFTSVFEPARALPEKGDAFPVAALLRHAAQVEDAELDRLSIAARGPQLSKAAFIVLENAPSLGALVNHRADDLSPESAAEQFGLFDQLSRGRLALHVEQPSTVAFAEKHNAHELAHESLDEYLTLLKRFWASDHPFDYEGRHHRVQNGHVAAKPFSRTGIPIVLGGRSGTALQVAARHADILALSPAPVGELRRHVARFRAATLPYRRADDVVLSLPVRTVVADSRDKAAALARLLGPADAPTEQRLVGTADQVALQFLALIDVGVTSFTLHGLQDQSQFDAFVERVLPLVRSSAARRDSNVQDLISGNGLFGFYPGTRPLIS